MNIQRLLHAVDRISTWVGKTAAWLIVVLMLVVVTEVFKRYALNAPTAWIYDVNNMMYGTLFMLSGAYTLAQDGHVRGDFVYGNLKPRTQAWIDLVLYVLFFLPGIGALTWAGWTYYLDSLGMNEHTFNATPLPLYPFKFVIPLAGAIVLLQGIIEMIPAWPASRPAHGRRAWRTRKRWTSSSSSSRRAPTSTRRRGAR